MEWEISQKADSHFLISGFNSLKVADGVHNLEWSWVHHFVWEVDKIMERVCDWNNTLQRCLFPIDMCNCRDTTVVSSGQDLLIVAGLSNLLTTQCSVHSSPSRPPVIDVCVEKVNYTTLSLYGYLRLSH